MMNFDIVCLNCIESLADTIEKMLVSEFGNDLPLKIVTKDYPSIDLKNLVTLFEKNDIVIFGDKNADGEKLLLLNHVNPLDVQKMPSCIILVSPENRDMLTQFEPKFPIFTIVMNKSFINRLKESCIYLIMDIKFRKQLTESVDRYSTILQGIADYVWQADINGHYIYLNDLFETNLGYKVGELLGKRRDDFLNPNQSGSTKHIVSEFRAGKKQVVEKYPFKKANGENIYVDSVITPVYDYENNLVSFLGVSRDITELWESQEKIKIQNKVLQTINKASQLILSEKSFEEMTSELLQTAIQTTKANCGIIAYLDSVENQYKVLIVYNGSSQWFTYPLNEMPEWLEAMFENESTVTIDGLLLEDDFLPDQIQKEAFLLVPCWVSAEVQAIILLGNSNNPFSDEQMKIMADEIGHFFSMALRYHNLQLKWKTFLKIYQTFLDMNLVGIYRLTINPPIPIEYDSESIARLILERMSFDYTNDRAAEMYGFSKGSELVGQRITNFVFDQEISIRHLKEFVENEFRATQKLSIEKDKYGNVRIFSNTFFGIIQDNKLSGIWGMQTDITAQKKYEEEYSKLYNAIQQASDAVLITDSEGFIEYVNPAFTKITGYQISEVLNKKPSILKSGKQDDSYYKKLWETIKSGKIFKNTIVNRKKDGTFYTEQMTITPVKNEIEQITHFVAIKRDITFEAQMTDLLVQNQKMEAVGNMASGIAHDFNNFLNGILGYISLMKMELTPENQFYEYISEMEYSTNKAADLAKRLMSFSRKEKYLKYPANLNDIIKNVLKLIKRTLTPDIKLDVSLADELRIVEVDSNQFETVIMNICINARDAMPEGGKLTIETKNVDFSDNIIPTMDFDTDHYVLLRIADTGHGMSEEVKRRIFEPYFTTKKDKGGTGLGLTMTFNIIKAHGGVIFVDSNPGTGTEFKIYLPAEGGKEVEKVKIKTQDKKVHKATNLRNILLVDDNMVVLKTGRRLLEKIGYTVTTAENGKVALDKFTRDPQGFDLIILDIIMPEMSGEKAFYAFREIRSDIPIILATGYSADWKTREMLKHGITSFLQKPYSLNELDVAINEIISMMHEADQ